MEAVAPTLVTAAMSGGSDAYEEFVVRPLDGRRLRSDAHALGHLARRPPRGRRAAAAAAGSLESISKELRLMKQILEGTPPTPAALQLL